MRHSGALAGVVVLAAGTVAAACFVPSQDVPPLTWLFVFGALVAGSAFAWTQPNAPATVRGWLWFSAGSLFVGAIFAFIDADIRGPSNGHVVFDLALGVAGSLVGVAGLVRCLFIRRSDAA